MGIYAIFQLAGTVLLLSVGQVLFKIAATQIVLSNSIWSSLRNPTLLVALGVYGFATVLWILVLRTIPLRLAYPFVAMAFVFVPIMAHFALAEPLKINTFIGFILILSGVWVSVRGW